jgi:hypothetical protein
MHADVAAESMATLLNCWAQMDPDRRGLTAAEVVQKLKGDPCDPSPAYFTDLRDAIEALVGKLDARALGNRLRSYRRRVFDGRFVDQAGTRKNAARWAVYPAEAFQRQSQETHHSHPVGGECGECGESSSTPGGIENAGRGECGECGECGESSSPAARDATPTGTPGAAADEEAI